MFQLILEADNLVRYKHPINALTQAVISSGTCTGQWFDDAKDGEVGSDLATNDTVIEVFNPSRYAVGDLISVKMDDLAFHVSTIDTIEATTITLVTGVTGPSMAGNRIARRFIGTLTLVPYGTPDVATKDWGFAVAHQSFEQADLYRGMILRFELTLDDGAGVNGFEWFRAKVVAPK